MTMTHDSYGKSLFESLLGQRWRQYDPRRCLDLGSVKAELDGVITDGMGSVICAVEIEARVYKQMRGALLDLALHSAPKKLFVVIMGQTQLFLANATREESENRALRHIQETWTRI